MLNIFQVVFFMYLWSIDMEAVPIAMSCFALLCEEADIRCGPDELTVTCLLPNYHIYLDLASASAVLTTGKCIEKYLFIVRKGFGVYEFCLIVKLTRILECIAVNITKVTILFRQCTLSNYPGKRHTYQILLRNRNLLHYNRKKFISSASM